MSGINKTLFTQEAWGSGPVADQLVGNVVVAFDWRIDQLSPIAGRLVTNDERQRSARFRFDRDRTAFLMARAGLRTILAEALGTGPLDLEFLYGAQGKPLLGLEHQSSGLRFNLSHSGGTAWLAVAWQSEVGVDCERVPIDQPLPWAVASKCLTKGEFAALETLQAPEQRAAFYRLWTQKEAVIKLTGDGLQANLLSFETPTIPGFAGWVDLQGENMLSLGRCWVEQLPSPDGFAAAVAVADQPQQVRRRTLRLRQ